MTRFALIHALAAKKKLDATERAFQSRQRKVQSTARALRSHVATCEDCLNDRRCDERSVLELTHEMYASTAIAQ
jgi:hypothetical protein